MSITQNLGKNIILYISGKCDFKERMLYSIASSGPEGYTQNSLDSQNALNSWEGNLRISKWIGKTNKSSREASLPSM